ncbi:hypothetical protein Tco_1089645, partial [Tanacetum coccineum]
MATPFANPERQFRARIDTSPAPIHNIYTFYVFESSESESEDVGEIDIETLTLEQYLALNLNNTRRRIRNPEDATFEIKGQFLGELRKTTFLRSSTENVIEHIGKVLKIASLFNVNDSTLLRVFPLTLVGVAKRWLDIISPEHAKNWDELSNQNAPYVVVAGDGGLGGGGVERVVTRWGCGGGGDDRGGDRRVAGIWPERRRWLEKREREAR